MRWTKALEQKLLAVCNRLRGPVDPTDYKANTFPLLCPSLERILTLAVVAHDDARRAIDVGLHVFPADRYRFDSRSVDP